MLTALDFVRRNVSRSREKSIFLLLLNLLTLHPFSLLCLVSFCQTFSARSFVGQVNISVQQRGPWQIPCIFKFSLATDSQLELRLDFDCTTPTHNYVLLKTILQYP